MVVLQDVSYVAQIVSPAKKLRIKALTFTENAALIQAPAATGIAFNASMPTTALGLIRLEPGDSIELTFSTNDLPYTIYCKGELGESYLELSTVKTSIN